MLRELLEGKNPRDTLFEVEGTIKLRTTWKESGQLVAIFKINDTCYQYFIADPDITPAHKQLKLFLKKKFIKKAFAYIKKHSNNCFVIDCLSFNAIREC